MQLCGVNDNSCTLITYYNPSIVGIEINVFDPNCDLIGFNPSVNPSDLVNDFDPYTQLPLVSVIREAHFGRIASSINHPGDGWGGKEFQTPFK